MTTHLNAPYTDKRVLVIGAGVSGQAATRLLLTLGAHVTVLDENLTKISSAFKAFLEEKGIACVGAPLSPELLVGYDIIVTSPGVPYTRLARLVAESTALSAHETLPEIMAETDLALQFVQAPIIAFTGTSGKTTTVSLTRAMLAAAGKKVFLGGNIGTPLSDLVLSQEAVDVIILELSSFQLQGCRHLHAHVAGILNLNANHLDQHTDMEEYTAAKFAIFQNQTEHDLALISQELMDEYAKRGGKAPAVIIPKDTGFQLDFLQGEHNIANAEAAFFASQPFGVTKAIALETAKNFKPLAHRLEYVADVQGVLYVNDSKSTTVDSLRVALQSFDAPVILLAGGKFKGGDLASLTPLMRAKVKAIALYGGSREFFEKAWQDATLLSWHEQMDDALHWAHAQATTGDVVLLSPATSSYDQFPNYIERGKHFCHLVEGLA